MNLSGLGTRASMTNPRTPDRTAERDSGALVDDEVPYERVHQVLDTVHSGGVSVEEAAAGLAADPAVGLPPLYLRTLLDHPGAWLADGDADQPAAVSESDGDTDGTTERP